MKPSNSRSPDALRPEEFPVGSPASRAAARTWLNQREKQRPDMRIIIGWGLNKAAIGRSLCPDGRLIEIVHPPHGWSTTQWQDFLVTETPEKRRLWEQYLERHGNSCVESTSGAQAANDEG